MKIIYIILGFLSLAIGIIGIFFLFCLPRLFITYFIFLHKRFKTLRTMVLGTSIYQKHLKSFHENRSLKKNTKIFILTFVTTMLLIGFISRQV